MLVETYSVHDVEEILTFETFKVLKGKLQLAEINIIIREMGCDVVGTLN
jgi:hypothetical protein